MNNQNQLHFKLHNLAFYTVSILGIILFEALSLSTLFISFYAEDMESQIMLFHYDPLWIQIPVLLLFAFLILGIRKLPDSVVEKICKILLPVTLLLITGLGLLLLIAGRGIPAADSYSVYAIGVSFAEGNLAAIQPTGNTYLSYYPQQIGLTAYYELVTRLWKLLPLSTPSYHVIKLLNIAFACFIVYFQYLSVGIIAKSRKAQAIYLLLAMGNLPLVFYTSFVYGEIPSFFCFSTGFYFLLKYVYGEESKGSLILSGIAFTLSVMLRKNTLILMIAVLSALLFHWIKTHKHLLGIYGIVVGILAVSILPATQKVYELRAGSTLLPGVSAYSYFAMGMQEAQRGNGWYNGFNFNTYQETGLDNELTDEISKAAINARLREFGDNPAYALSFYRDKLLSQWTDGSYAGRQAIVSAFDTGSGFGKSLFTGSLGQLFTGYCNIYQLVIYAGVLLFLIRNRCCKNLPLYIGIIGIIGGFLFHLIWEANSRYILPYWLFMMPYAAMAFTDNKKSRTSHS